jgi:hypothetical protein
LHRNYPCFWGVERLQEAQLNLLRNAHLCCLFPFES